MTGASAARPGTGPDGDAVLAAPMSTRTFSAVSAIISTGAPGVFSATLDPAWTIGGKPNGGYLLALLGRAATRVGSHDHVLAASAHYLRSPDPGQVEIHVDVLRTGRSAGQLRVRMVQSGQQCVEALVTTGRLDPDSTPYWQGGVPDAGTEQAAFADAVRLPSTNPAGVPVPIMDEVDLRLDRSSLGFGSGRPSGRGELRGWLELPGGEAFGPESLLYAVDAFPPATFDVEITGWVPTLELSVYVRALPAPGPVRIVHRAHLVDAQRVDESCWIWDSRGRVVAQSTQLAGIRLG